jgi:hypothetical protein
MTDCLAILWEPDQLTAVDARVGKDGVQLVKSVVVDRPVTVDSPTAAMEWGEKLRERLQAAGMTTRRTLVLAPRALAVTRLLDVPDVPAWELPDIVRLQAATKAGLPGDAITLDYLPVPEDATVSGKRVLAFTIDAARLIECRSLLGPANLEWVGLAVTSTAVAEAAVRVLGTTAQPALVIHQRGPRLELTIIDEGHVVFSHATRLATANDPRPLTAELTRATVALGQVHHGMELDRVVYIPEQLETSNEIQALLRERYGDRLVVVDPRIDLTSEIRGWSEAPDCSVALAGMLLAECMPRLPGIDFLRPRRPQPPRQLKIPRWAMGAAAAVVFLLLTAWWSWSSVSSLEADIAAARDESRNLQALLDKGKPTFDADGLLRTWEVTDVSPTETWQQLVTVLPETDRLYLTRVDWSPGANETLIRIRGDMAARDRSDFAELGHSLDTAGIRQQPKAVVGNPRDPEYPVAMELDVSMLREAPAAASAAPAKKP